MAYTALFVEVLIVGVQASTWIALLMARFLFRTHGSLEQLWQNLTTAGAVTIIVPWVYTIGIFFDRLGDDVFWKIIAPPVLKRKQIARADSRTFAS